MNAPEPDVVDLEGAFAIVQKRLGPLEPAKATFGSWLRPSYRRKNPSAPPSCPASMFVGPSAQRRTMRQRSENPRATRRRRT